MNINKLTQRISMVMIASAMALSFSYSAEAQTDYPQKTITMLIGAGAGGSTDSGGRILAAALEKELGQKIVVINKPGGGGTKAANILKQADADGYTLSYAYSHHYSFGPYYGRNEALYTVDDFSFIGSVTEPRHSIVSLADKPWNDLGELVEHFKAQGKPIRMAYGGGSGRLIGQAIIKGFDYPVKIIRVKGGSASMQQLLGGHIDIVFSGGVHTPFTEAGDTKVIAAVDVTRDPDYPEIKTLMEFGVDVAAPTVQLVVAPKGLPDDVRQKLTDAVLTVRQNPEIIKLYRTNLKMRMDTRNAQELQLYMINQEESYKAIIAKFGN